MDVKVVENADNCVHITMPADPSGSMELSDQELSNAAGGGCAAGTTYDGCVNFLNNCAGAST